ncbi:MAG: hypothetical protein Rhirs2KO_18100 [Rhizobiaceae bacterium]
MSAAVTATIAGTLLGTSAAVVRFHLAAYQLCEVLKFNPNWPSQPRVPAGNPEGGQWTVGGAQIIPVQARPPNSGNNASRRVRARRQDITLNQATRLDISYMQMQSAVWNEEPRNEKRQLHT